MSTCPISSDYAIKNNRESGKYLLYKNKRWKCWFFPDYSCLDGDYDIDKEKSSICACLRRDLDVIDDNIDIEYIGNEISHKHSIPDRIEKKYKFHFFMVNNIKISSAKNCSFQFNGKKYKWKTLDQMYASNNIVKKNEDVLDYIRKNCNIC
jgi:hypothetical protein